MRTGNSGVQQGLTAEAATIVKQAVTLARRRGHAQVTPLHVANTMLAVTNGLLRTACLQSHSHPLQCKALELCFNVALNRLPASTSSAMLGSQSHHAPSISNALVAAFKRAQAHQRRGSIENQQQPLLAVKIELEQLVISILDDPSVSRVMREAGFSSTQVKSNVQQAVSLEICSHNTAAKSKENNTNVEVSDEDIASVLDNLENQRKRSIVIVGECLPTLEGLVKGVMDKVDKGECLRGVNFVSLSLSDYSRVPRVEVDRKIQELRGFVTGSNNTKGHVLYLGDLKWLFEYRASSNSISNSNSCGVEHMIVEIGKMVSGVGECARFWVMGIATFKDYMRCKNGHPSLETLWGLHPITIPAATLRLSLNTDSGLQNQSTSKKAENGSGWLLLQGGENDQKQTPACFAEPSTKFDAQVRSFQDSTCNSHDSSTSSLPTWLQQYKNENKGVTSKDQNCVPAGDLCKEWNSMSHSIEKQLHPCEKALSLISSISPTSSTSYEQQHPNLHDANQQCSLVEPKQIQSHMWRLSNETTLRMYIPECKDTKQPFSPTSNPNSTSSSDAMEVEYVGKFKELNSENLKTLCSALEQKVPWQNDIIPEIASTVLQCRSGMLRRKGKVMRSSDQAKEESWLFFLGNDIEAKEKIAMELAGLVFGSCSNFVSISLSSFSSARSDSSSEECRNKRSRNEPSCSYINRFADAVSSNPHRVFLVEDIEQADYCSQVGFKRAIERARVVASNGEEVDLRDAIIILSCESFSSRSRPCSPSFNQKSCQGHQEKKDDVAIMEDTSPCLSLDLNISIDGECNEEDHSVDHISGLLESVDRRIIFNIQEL